MSRLTHYCRLLFIFLFLATLNLQIVKAISPDQDTDGDGIPDMQEDKNGNGIVDPGETDPMNADTDRGGESDGSEVAGKRNPLDKNDDLTYDQDGDGWNNGVELQHGTDPKNPDTDGDGIIDPKDPFPLDPQHSTDQNQNKLPDEWEKQTGLNQQLATPSRTDDPDGDGLTNAEELARGTDPLSVDTDRDGVDDKTEIDEGTNPRENPCLVSTASSEPFPDMTGHWASKNTEHLRRIKILPDNVPLLRGYDLEGKTKPLFRPDQPVSRFEFLKMVLFSTCTKLRARTEIEKPFPDIRNTPVIAENPEAVLKRQVVYTASHFAIIEGYPDGTFKPDAPINRAEAVKVLMLGAHLPDLSETGSTLFPDISGTDWFYAFLKPAADRKIVTGYLDGLFRPGNLITRAEAAALIERTMLRNPTINGYVLLEGES